MAVLERRVARHRAVQGEVAGNLHAPRRPVRLRVVRDHGHRTAALAEQCRDAKAGARRPLVGRKAPFRRLVLHPRGVPFLGTPSGDGNDVVPGLVGQPAGAGTPVRDPFLPGIVGSCSEAEIAEAVGEVAEIVRRGGDCLHRIIGVLKATQRRRTWHELSDTLCTFRAERVLTEPALLPDQPGEELHRQAMRCSGLIDQRANRRSGQRWFRLGDPVLCRDRRHDCSGGGRVLGDGAGRHQRESQKRDGRMMKSHPRASS